MTACLAECLATCWAARPEGRGGHSESEALLSGRSGASRRVAVRPRRPCQCMSVLRHPCHQRAQNCSAGRPAPLAKIPSRVWMNGRRAGESESRLDPSLRRSAGAERSVKPPPPPPALGAFPPTATLRRDTPPPRPSDGRGLRSRRRESGRPQRPLRRGRRLGLRRDSNSPPGPASGCPRRPSSCSRRRYDSDRVGRGFAGVNHGLCQGGRGGRWRPGL